MKKCLWKEDEDGNWETSCDEMFCLTIGTPHDNGMAYCCYCGKKLDELRYMAKS